MGDSMRSNTHRPLPAETEQSDITARESEMAYLPVSRGDKCDVEEGKDCRGGTANASASCLKKSASVGWSGEETSFRMV